MASSGPHISSSNSSRPACNAPSPCSHRSPTRLQPLVSTALAWFASHARPLPWRQKPTPYGIWISEIMLQQTQVKTVIPYWTRWMRSLPTIAQMAAARPSRILKLWEGLGYYSRARHAHATAKLIHNVHRDTFPTTPEQLRALPGIGPYTAGAIASLAFNQPAPILDGNIIRLFTRLFAITANARSPSTLSHLWALSSDLVHLAAAHPAPNSVRSFNESLMELGALVCLPAKPRCPDCPLRHLCLAHRRQIQHQLPVLPPRVPATERAFAALVIHCDSQFLVQQRPPSGLNPFLWEFPNREHPPTELCTPGSIPPLFNLPPLPVELMLAVKHSITRYRITLRAWYSQLPGSHPLPTLPRSRWATLSQLDKLPFTSAHRKILNHLITQSK